jgi:hypothetical protein
MGERLKVGIRIRPPATHSDVPLVHVVNKVRHPTGRDSVDFISRRVLQSRIYQRLTVVSCRALLLSDKSHATLRLAHGLYMGGLLLWGEVNQRQVADGSWPLQTPSGWRSLYPFRLYVFGCPFRLPFP